MCEENPHLKFLVVVYNTSTREHGERVFPCNRNPKNVVCKTAHSLARTIVCQRYKDTKMCDNLTTENIMYSGMVTKTKGLGRGSYSRLCSQVNDTLKSFMNSDDEEIIIEHVPTHWEAIGDIPLWQRFVFSKI